MQGELKTVGAIAREIGVPRPRLDYAIEKAGIRERCRAGIIRLFSTDQIPVLRAALDQVRPSNRAPAGESSQ